MKKELTKAEEQVMHYLWDLERAFLKDVVEKFPEPKPAYTTISTVIRVLVKKGFVAFKTYGKINEYYPLVSKARYFQQTVKPMVTSYLDDTPAALASFFTNAKLSLEELEEIRNLVDEKIKKLKKSK